MMKQFLRVKQIADQKFQRSDKSGVLTEELNAAERRVDLIKESCYASGKKLSACMQRLVQDSNDRKISKKIPEAALAQCMEEWGLSLGENSILGMTLVDYARIQEALANDLLNYKVQVEENVVEPLQNILNIDINKIMKYRKQLFKLTSDMESAKMRYQSALRSSQQATGNGAAAAAAKVQLLKEEAEDITSRADQCRDSLTAEMFNLISREPEMSQLFVKLCQLQLEYHKKAFYMLESALPELKAQISSCPYQPVFGISLEEHLKVTKREIATVIETCVCWLLETAMEEEGLFRIGGSMIKIKKVKSAFDAGFQHLIEEDRDPHNVAGVLKLYLRSLPEPLLTFELYDQWMNAAVEADHDTRLRALWSVVNSLPEAHLKNLRYLIKFLAKLCKNSDVNKMSVQNISIVIGPNLLWPPVEECALGMNMTATNLHSSIVDTLITYADWFFPGDCEFYMSTPTSPRHIEGFPPPSLSSSQLSLSTAKLSNGDSAVDSMSSSPTNSSPKSPSPRVPIRPRKKAAPKAPSSQSTKSMITRSLSCGGFQANVLARANTVHNNSKLSQHSVSHEDLLKVNYNEISDKIAKGSDEAATMEINPPVAVNSRPKSRPKPPRHHRNGLPPVAERTHKVIERPSVPPPERPDSYAKSDSVSSEDVFIDNDKALDLDDISISLNSSGSETYNECQMSFMDESDNEERFSKSATKNERNSLTNENHRELNNNKSEVSESLNDHCKRTISFNNQNITTNGTSSSEFVNGISNSKKVPVSVANNTDYEVNDSNVQVNEKNSNSFSVDNNVANGCHFTGGTPTWFEHYGDDKRQSTLWFSNQETDEMTYYNKAELEEIDNFECNKDASGCENFRTIIEVGSTSETFSSSKNASYQSTVSGTAIKLRVNSETQDTRL